MTGPDAAPPTAIDPSRPHPARVYDWWLGGKEQLVRPLLACPPDGGTDPRLRSGLGAPFGLRSGRERDN